MPQGVTSLRPASSAGDASSEERWDLFSGPVTGIPGPRRRRQPGSNLDSAPKHSRHQTEEALQAGADKLTEYCRSLEAQLTECAKNLELSRKEVERYGEELKGANEALRVLIGGIDQQKKSVEKAIQDSFSLTVKPILDRLKTEALPNRVADLIDLLAGSLDNIADPFAKNSMGNGCLLTLREMRICELIFLRTYFKGDSKHHGSISTDHFFSQIKHSEETGADGNRERTGNVSTPERLGLIGGLTALFPPIGDYSGSQK